jgi:Uncharacterized protein involved in cytokinesis, contains TGc (transglutaminase/protease-like) domain
MFLALLCGVLSSCNLLNDLVLFKITFYNYDNTFLYSENFHAGELVTYNGTTPTRENDDAYSYTFSGWDKVLGYATQDTDFTAEYTKTLLSPIENTYTVNFLNYNSTLLYSTTVKEGEYASYVGETPVRENDDTYTYTFSGWDKDPATTIINTNTDFVAQYSKTAIDITEEYTVRFLNYDDSILQTSMVLSGNYVSYIGTTPTRSSDTNYNYTFSGWDKDPTTIIINANTDFIAQYTKTAISSGTETTIVSPTSTKMGYTLTIDNVTKKETKSDFTYLPLAYSDDYGFEYLGSLSTTLKNKYQYVYCSIWEGCVDLMNSSGTLDYYDYSGTRYYLMDAIDLSYYYSNISSNDTDDITSILELFRGDNPYMYWLDANLFYSTTEIYPIVYDGYNSSSKRSAIYTKIDSYLIASKTLVSSYSTEDAKAYQLYLKIINDVSYAYTSGSTTEAETAFWAHNAAGVVTNGKVVCEGYALMYALLCRYNSIQCLFGIGCVDISSTTAKENSGHAWNYINLGDTWYCVDSTWGDNAGYEATYYKQKYEVFKNKHHLGELLSFYFSVPTPIY